MWKINYFSPIIEKNLGQEPFLPEHPAELLRKGAGKDVDVMIGYTDEEGLFGISMFSDSISDIFSKSPDLLLPASIVTKTSPDKVLELGERAYTRYFGDKNLKERGIRGIVTFISESGNYSIKSLLNFWRSLLNLEDTFTDFVAYPKGTFTVRPARNTI